MITTVRALLVVVGSAALGVAYVRICVPRRSRPTSLESCRSSGWLARSQDGYSGCMRLETTPASSPPSWP